MQPIFDVLAPAGEGTLARRGFGALYVVLGTVGVLLNLTTVVMIATRRVYRLSAYRIMANVALADALMTAVIGIVCGIGLLLSAGNAPLGGEEGPPSRWPAPPLVADSLFLGDDTLLHVDRTAPVFPEIRRTMNKRSFWQMSQTYIKKRRRQNESKSNGAQRKSRLRRGINDAVVFNRKPIMRHTKPTASLENDKTVTTAALLVSFAQIAAWTVGVMSYAFLGLNRCVAICFYGTNARRMNRIWVAVFSSFFTWVVGLTAAYIGTFPRPYVECHPELWTLTFTVTDESRSITFFALSLSVYGISVALQWVCSALVLVKIHQVKQKISRNKLNESSAIRFKKQARLTFQFLYPSLFCTISSLLYFVKPFCRHLLDDWHLIALHIVWLLNHLCNPFIYAYFNDRMRVSYREFLTCAHVRHALARRRRRRNLFKRRNFSRRSHHMSTRSAGAVRCKSDGNFVRNSLQMQSRDFEQLCEFMMRVNPLGDSSEGWRESSSDASDSNGEPADRRTLDELSHAMEPLPRSSFRIGRLAVTAAAVGEDGVPPPSKFRKYWRAQQN